MIGFGITDDGRKKALLLHYGGDELDVFQTLKQANTTYDKAKEVLDAYFQPKQSTLYETILFRREKQQKTESIDQYCTKLRKLAEKCNFADQDREIKTQIIEGCLSSQLRRKVLEKDRTLEELLELARSLSLSECRMKEVETSAEVNRVLAKQYNRSKAKAHTHKQRDTCSKQCYHCGGNIHMPNNALQKERIVTLVERQTISRKHVGQIKMHRK